MKKLVIALLAFAACRTQLPGGGLTGRVVVTGEADVHGIVVTASGVETASTTTAGDGSWGFDSLTLGEYTITATVPSTLEGALSASVSVDGPTEAPELRFTPAGGLAGRVTRGGSATGNAGILVTAGGTSGVGVTDDAGGYHIDLVPTASYDVHASVTGYQAGVAADQVVHWGETTMVPEIDLVIAPGHASLRGVALRFGASDHSGTQVTVGGTGLSTTTASDGSWAIDGVPEGTFSLGFTNGVFAETIPTVETLAGSDGFVVDESLYSLPISPLTLYAARRIEEPGGMPDTFTLSPKGDRLLYDNPKMGQLSVVALDGSGTVVLEDNWYGNFSQWVDLLTGGAFSVDGTQVAFQRANALELVAAGGGTPTHLADGVGSFSFSPDGSLLAWSSPDPVLGTPTVSVAPSGGGQARVLFSEAKLASLRWSGDGSHFIYRTDLDNYFMLGTVKLIATSGGASPIIVAGGAWDPNLSPDRRWAVIASNVSTDTVRSDLVSVDLQAGVVTTLDSNVNHDPFSFAGARVIYTKDQTIWSTPLAGGAPLQLATGASPTVSPDGSRVAYTTDCVSPYYFSPPCALWTVPAAGGTPQMIASSVYQYSFSDDGNTLLYMTDQSPQGGAFTLWTAANGQPPKQIDTNVYNLAYFTADGSHVIYLKDPTSNAQGTLRIAALADGASLALASDAQIYSVRRSPDGKRFSFITKPVNGAQTLWAAPADGGAATPLYDGLQMSSWSAANVLVGLRAGTAAPYRFQNGFYVLAP